MHIFKANEVGYKWVVGNGYACTLHHNASGLSIEPGDSFYGYISEGWVNLGERGRQMVSISAGYAFVANDTDIVGVGDDTRFTGILRHGFKAPNVLGVRIEEQGRVQYIDGCTDTLVVAPPRLGDPCLNSLHFPPNTCQSFHTHPSIRGGVVVRGSLFADTADGLLHLEEGDGWLIDAFEQHRFITGDHTDGAVVLAFHPDSDWGPTDEVHVMKNRTYITPGLDRNDTLTGNLRRKAHETSLAIQQALQHHQSK